jgi:tetratricopeptide (TPR) repeat protein
VAAGAGAGGGGSQGGSTSRPRGQGGAPGSGARGGRRVKTGGIPPWALLLIGLSVGGAVGYSLQAAVSPRDESGMIRGPADIMAGAGAGAPAGDGGMPSNQMLPGVIEALAKYRNVLAEDPGNVDANIGMGNMMFDSNKWDKAIEHYSKALEGDPKNADVRVDRAIAYHTLGQNQAALDELTRVTREVPEHKNAWLNLGVVAGALGDQKRNIAAWEQYLKLEPNGPHSDAIRKELAAVKSGG